MRIVLISDTHGKHEQLIVPSGDILIHAGDFTNIGEPNEIAAFNRWFAAQPHPWKILIAGNHDRLFELNPAFARSLLDRDKIVYLEDDYTEIGSLKIYGSPWTPVHKNAYWKFHRIRSGMQRVWKKIPEGLDILITHGPPYGVLDWYEEHAGCKELNYRLIDMEEPPKVHVFGHIHTGYGSWNRGTTMHYNVSSVGELVNGNYEIQHQPIVIDCVSEETEQ